MRASDSRRYDAGQAVGAPANTPVAGSLLGVFAEWVANSHRQGPNVGLDETWPLVN
jgi:hypothetical protein